MIRYFHLDEAREELHQRWADRKLRADLQLALGTHFLPAFAERPRSILFRQVASPDNGFVFFWQCAHYLNTSPFLFEYHDDSFSDSNPEKMALIRPLVRNGSETYHISLSSRTNARSRKISEVTVWDGRTLPQFHWDLFQQAGYQIDRLDNSAWIRNLGTKPSCFYPVLLLHLVAHGILFEVFSSVDESPAEARWTQEILLPILEDIKNRYGLDPLIVRLYPDGQDDAENQYWFSYPKQINDHLIDLQRNHNLPRHPYKSHAAPGAELGAANI